MNKLLPLCLLAVFTTVPLKAQLPPTTAQETPRKEWFGDIFIGYSFRMGRPDPSIVNRFGSRSGFKLGADINRIIKNRPVALGIQAEWTTYSMTSRIELHRNREDQNPHHLHSARTDLPATSTERRHTVRRNHHRIRQLQRTDARHRCGGLQKPPGTRRHLGRQTFVRLPYQRLGFQILALLKLGIEPFNTVRRPKTRLHPTGHTAQPRFHEPLCRSEILTRQHRQ